MALALACVFQSQSHSKLGQSHGFQAKPGQHITTWDIFVSFLMHSEIQSCCWLLPESFS
jgi:hypothetical protein